MAAIAGIAVKEYTSDDTAWRIYKMAFDFKRNATCLYRKEPLGDRFRPIEGRLKTIGWVIRIELKVQYAI